jgi:hypothetical protein
VSWDWTEILETVKGVLPKVTGKGLPTVWISPKVNDFHALGTGKGGLLTTPPADETLAFLLGLVWETSTHPTLLTLQGVRWCKFGDKWRDVLDLPKSLYVALSKVMDLGDMEPPEYLWVNLPLPPDLKFPPEIEEL